MSPDEPAAPPGSSLRTLANAPRNWAGRQDATSPAGVGIGWWQRYRNIDGPRQSLLLTVYVFLAVLPATLVLVEYVQRNPAALANEMVHGYGLRGSTAGLLRSVLVGDHRHELGSAVLAIAGALFFGLGFGRVLQFVHARSWGIDVDPKLTDEGRYAAVLLVLYGLILLVLVDQKLFAGWSPWLYAAFVPVWIAALAGYFAWAPWLLMHRRLPVRDLLPGAILTSLGLVALMFVSGFAMPAWVNLYATDFAGFGVVMALFFWLGLSSTVIVVAAGLSPALAERRKLLSQP